MYISCDASKLFITVILPMRVSLRCEQSFIILDIFSERSL